MTTENRRCTTPPVVSVIIPTLFRPKQVIRLLNSIAALSDPPPYEILVVSNLFDAELKQLITSNDIRVSLHSVGQIGVNRARNLGLKLARGEILLFLDDDCVIDDPNFFTKHYCLHQKNPDCIGIGGFYRLPAKAGSVAQAYHWIADLWLAQSRTKENLSLNLLGGNSSFKSAKFKPHYQFDEAIVFGGSETELHARLISEGQQLLLCDDLNIIHEAKMNSYQFCRKAFQQGHSRARLDATGRKSKQCYRPQLLTMEEHWPRFHSASQLRYLRTRFFICLYHFCFRRGQIVFQNKLDRSKNVCFGSTSPLWSLVSEIFFITQLEITRLMKPLRRKQSKLDAAVPQCATRDHHPITPQ